MPDSDSADDWDSSYEDGSPPWDIGGPQAAFARIASSFAGAVLDAGCGTGEHTMLAASSGAQALGIDISPRAIKIAERKAFDRNIDARFQVLSIFRIQELKVFFDQIIDSGLFHVFNDTDRGRYVAALHAVLRPGGRLRLMCFSDKQAGDWGPRRISTNELEDAFRSGWRIESIAPERFQINWERWQLDTPIAEAWFVESVRL